MVQVVRCSGTIKKVEEAAVRAARVGIVRAREGVLGAGAGAGELDVEIEVMGRVDSEGSEDEG